MRLPQQDEDLQRPGCGSPSAGWKQMRKKIRCRSCGAEYDSRETKCPWCGTRTEAGAEREYMEKLSEVKDDLEGLSDIPGQSFRRNAGAQFRQLRRILIFAFLLFLIPAGMLAASELRERNTARRELAWEKEHYPELNTLYREKRYEELTDLVEEAMEQEQPVWNWRHYSFAMGLLTLRSAEQCRELLEQADPSRASGELSAGEKQTLTADLLFYELRLENVEEVRDLSEEELSYLLPRSEPWIRDRKQRFPMTEDARQAFYGEDWHVDYGKCLEYVQKQNAAGG